LARWTAQRGNAGIVGGAKVLPQKILKGTIMAKTIRGTKSGRKSGAAKVQSGAKQKGKVASGSDLANFMEVEPSPIVSRRAPSDDNARRADVINCVNGALDANRPGWNSDGQGDTRAMDKDLHYDVHSIPAFLGVVSRCLAPTYALTIDSSLVQACVSATVATVKFLVFNKTK
jgi:hypothetical protein